MQQSHTTLRITGVIDGDTIQVDGNDELEGFGLARCSLSLDRYRESSHFNPLAVHSR